jgi:hypothetical protein
MSRFTRTVLCAAALVLCLAVLPLVSMGQQATVDAQGRSITTISPRAGTPSASVVNPDEQATVDSQGRAVTTTPSSAGTPSPNVVKPDHANDELTTIIYSNFGHGDSYKCCIGYTETGPTSGEIPVIQAMAFTPTKGTYLLLQLDLAIGYLKGTNGYKLELRADDEGQPGRTIASWEVKQLPVFGDTSTAVETIDALASAVELSKGHQYWLVPIANSNEWAEWNFNSVSAKGNGAFSLDGGATWTILDYNPNGAFDVLGLKLY